MNATRLRTIEQVRQFLAGSQEIEYSAAGGDEERYGHISRVLRRFDYLRLGRADKGVILAYLRRTSGYNADVCGPAIAHLLRRAYSVYGESKYERLA